MGAPKVLSRSSHLGGGLPGAVLRILNGRAGSRPDSHSTAGGAGPGELAQRPNRLRYSLTGMIKRCHRADHSGLERQSGRAAAP